MTPTKNSSKGSYPPQEPELERSPTANGVLRYIDIPYYSSPSNVFCLLYFTFHSTIMHLLCSGHDLDSRPVFIQVTIVCESYSKMTGHITESNSKMTGILQSPIPR